MNGYFISAFISGAYGDLFGKYLYIPVFRKKIII